MLDFRATRFEDVVGDVDVVIDLVGGEVQARSFAVLKPGGALISAVSPPDQAIAATHGIRAAFFLVDVTTACLTHIAASIETGALVATVGAVLPLAAARVAHEMLEGQRPRPRGKIVLKVAE
jgi:NADPH:quinone reductase-like Zn-dependent oxidoreductase